jgi:hypothetical protein
LYGSSGCVPGSTSSINTNVQAACFYNALDGGYMKAICNDSGGNSGSNAEGNGAGNSGAYDPNLWFGQYTPVGCDRTLCCCYNRVDITAVNNNKFVLSGPVSGNCGSFEGTTVSVIGSVPASNTYSYTAAGNSHRATLQGDTITDTDTDDGRCSAVLTRGISAAASGASLSFNLLLAVLAALFTATCM